MKLITALARAGLKTQAALADRIAEQEGLDTVPRGVVYRVFREQPVDLRTLTRIARALDTGVQDLLLAPDEAGAEAPGTPGSVPEVSAPGGRWPAWRAAAFAAPLVAAAVLFAFQVTRDETGSLADPPPDVIVPADLSRFTFAVLPLSGDLGDGLADALRTRLAEHTRVVPVALMPAGPGADDADATAASFGVDVVVDGRVITAGRHAALRLDARMAGSERVFWVAHTRRRALTEGLERVAGAAVEALAVALAPGSRPGPFPTAAAQQDYVRGRNYLDQSRSELNVRRALNQFEAALRGEETFAAAHAGLCLGLLQQSLISSEARVVTDAKGACGRAAELAPELPLVHLARGHLARRIGELEQARRLFEAALEQDPGHPEALMGLAEVFLAEYRGGDGAARAGAVEYARLAMEAAPDFWKTPFTLARIHFFTGDVDAAVEIGKKAVSADANALTLANLGTSYFCRGDHQAALSHYLEARATAPNASMGEEQMCVAYYFARRFDEAVAACRAAVAIDSSGGRPAHHEMWGNLADAYRQAGRVEEAADAYARAVELAERNLLVSGHSVNVRAHLTYYYLALTVLDPTRVPSGIAEKLPGELADNARLAVEPQALIRIASAWALIGDLDQARAAYRAGTGDCPGFGASPDLDPLHLSFNRRP